eukprot:TRINITY_DN5694_c1_g1_i1.p3 TRINITY_DN5694_c1_g1~~TRINITY_DN5694_c1_g1_i1.p3  ORF type:complete len:195 (+),score=44.08 TRINITY_DN5694_c1_g1_i1:82-666(+)
MAALGLGHHKQQQQHRFSDAHSDRQTRFAHLNRLPSAGRRAAVPLRQPPAASSAVAAEWGQQAPLQGRLRPQRRGTDAESRSGSEQGLTPDPSPRDPSPPFPVGRPGRIELGAKQAAASPRVLPVPSGKLCNLNPGLLGLGGAAAALAGAGVRHPSTSSLYHRRMSDIRLPGPQSPKGNGGRTGHSKWGRRRRH